MSYNCQGITVTSLNAHQIPITLFLVASTCHNSLCSLYSCTLPTVTLSGLQFAMQYLPDSILVSTRLKDTPLHCSKCCHLLHSSFAPLELREKDTSHHTAKNRTVALITPAITFNKHAVAYYLPLPLLCD